MPRHITHVSLPLRPEATYLVLRPVIIGNMSRGLVGLVACHRPESPIRFDDVALGKIMGVYSNSIGHGRPDHHPHDTILRIVESCGGIGSCSHFPLVLQVVGADMLIRLCLLFRSEIPAVACSVS